MSFVSPVFWIFAVLLFFLFYCVPARHRWVLMLCASYLFYAWWDWRYAPLLLVSSAVDFYCVGRMARLASRAERKPWLCFSLAVNLGLLFIFKYWNFVGTNINALFGSHIQVHELLLPLGVSFYTFQTLSYSIDAYYGRIKPERHFGMFCLYVSFFPQLVAGPIERSQALLPQLSNLSRPTLEQFRHGLLLIVWGLFLKLVIADNLTPLINGIYFSNTIFPFYLYWFAGSLVAFKIYCDFMAYSEIARGLAQLFGVKLTMNFRRPFLATDLHQFWQRWHISLTRWIGVYLQMPMARQVSSEVARSAVTIVTMTVIGLWHGASWNFVLFGLYHGIVLAIWNPVAELFARLSGWGSAIRAVAGRLSLFVVLTSSSTMFYIVNGDDLFRVLHLMLDVGNSVHSFSLATLPGKFDAARALAGLGILTIYSLIAEYRSTEYVTALSRSASRPRWLAASSVVTLTLLLGNFDVERFVYFEF